MRRETYESWTRTDGPRADATGAARVRRKSEERSAAGRGSGWSDSRGRRALAALGAALILLSLGMVLVQLRSEGGSAAAAAAAVAAAPKDQTMKLTIPSMQRVRDVPVYSAPVKEEAALRNGTAHVEGTGFPWQREANVYIAGHRLGYPRTESFLVFWDLNKLRGGKKVVLEDSEGSRYVYRVFDRIVVGPGQVHVKKPMAGKNIVSLQTCTLPDYEDRLIVRAELVKTVDPPAQASTD